LDPHATPSGSFAARVIDIHVDVWPAFLMDTAKQTLRQHGGLHPGDFRIFS
jgi:hypothetical protein